MTRARDLLGERRLLHAWYVLRDGLPSTGRYRRYLVGMVPVLALIWLLTAAYLLLVPKSYTSEFTLILPGSGMGSSMNLESIGQAQSSANSAFSSPTLSPTENYKQLLTADVTMRAAARIAHENEDRFPAPTIKLVEQTNLINVSIAAHGGQAAQRRARALLVAFAAQLETLRNDEAAKREAADLKHLQDLSIKEQASQRKLIAFQASHGLATLEQFNARIASADALRDKLRDLRVQLSQQSGTSGRLSSSLRSNPQSANLTMRLRGDPVFQELAQRYAASNADASQKSGTLGPAHSAMAQANGERAELRAALVRRGRELTGLPEDALLAATDIQLADGRSNLMQAMTNGDALAAGTRASLAELRGDLAKAQARSPELIAQASELADLQRDHRVAEAVFSSALARIDTNKQDPFASYPLVQTLAAPSLPIKPASPSLTIALAGALAGTLFTLIGFGLIWLRQPIIDRILKKL